ncbi:MAG: FAD-dependent oxidoreductase [Rubrivivax sp.]|nr:FAD-dependent oxidoreductase [Rubrivivax sp.]
MSARPGTVQPIWTTGSTEVFKTGTWRAALPRHIEAPSPCHAACPVGGEIAEWIGLARAGDWRAAWDVLTRHNPFPAIAGRVCHHPCESVCNRGPVDGAVSICQLERFAGDRALAESWAFAPPALERTGHVAIVGGGPAGLSAAFQLRRRGWRVSLYESRSTLGGLMRHGIPAYRLAREVLDAEIARIVALGIELHLEHPLHQPAALDALRASHDAVFVATGAALPRHLPDLPADPRVLEGAAFLAAANAGTPPALGPRVVVIGGGSAALDAARSARRAGHAVTLVALEARAQMPAQRDEVEEALEEGTMLVDGAMLAQLDPLPGGLRLTLRRVCFEAATQHRLARVEAIAGTDFVLAADALIVSIGQDPDLAPFAGRLPAAGRRLAIAADGATALPGVWAGGDLASDLRYVTEAVGMGRRAALAIHRTLLGEVAAVCATHEPVPLQAIATWAHASAPRVAAARRSPQERLASGGEVQLGLVPAQALAEAQRCYSCGRCIQCDLCVTWCPDLAVRHEGAGYTVDADYCKGCGLCVRECPTGSMLMEEETR